MGARPPPAPGAWLSPTPRCRAPAPASVVLLGECTHGTEEFYKLRAEITKVLCETRGFSAVVFEADWPTMEQANDYIVRCVAPA